MPKTTLARLSAVLLALLCTSQTSHAYDAGATMWIGSHTPVLMNSLNLMMLDTASGQLGRKNASNAGHTAPVPEKTTIQRIDAASVDRTLRRLAQGYPAERQSDAVEVFKELLAAFREIELKFGLTPNDMSNAVAAYVAGSYMAYRNADFPDAHFRPLANQMRGIISQSPLYATASLADRQDAFIQMAVVGMMMATTNLALKQRPDGEASTRLRLAAKSYLEQFLHTEAARVQINSEGLVLK